MPATTIHLLSLVDPSTLPSLLTHIKQSKITPLVISKPVRWIIRPEHITVSDLLTPRWDLLLILESNPQSQDFIMSLTSTEPTSWTSNSVPQIAHHFSTRAGVPSRLTKSFHETNRHLLHPKTVPDLTGALDRPLLQSSSQDLSLSGDLKAWVESRPVIGAVSMLNFLAFKPGQKDNYLKYGKAFAESIGSKRGGNAKLVGNVIDSPATGTQGWDEFALAHYPSLLHFADMLASTDYQEVNQKYRVGSLADTCILCTSELEIEKLVGSSKAKL